MLMSTRGCNVRPNEQLVYGHILYLNPTLRAASAITLGRASLPYRTLPNMNDGSVFEKEAHRRLGISKLALLEIS